MDDSDDKETAMPHGTNIQNIGNHISTITFGMTLQHSEKCRRLHAENRNGCMTTDQWRPYAVLFGAKASDVF